MQGLFCCWGAAKANKICVPDTAGVYRCLVSRLDQALWTRFLQGVVLLFCCSCGQQIPPLLLTILPPVGATVGRELTVPLLVQGSEELLQWSWESLTTPELGKRLRRPSLTTYSRGRAVWRWTPMADDAGEQEVAFSVSSAQQQVEEHVKFVVAVGGDPPVFREPVGEGTTLDLRQTACAAVSVAVESSAAAMVELSLEDAPENAAFAQTLDLTGSFCFVRLMRRLRQKRSIRCYWSLKRALRSCARATSSSCGGAHEALVMVLRAVAASVCAAAAATDGARARA